MSTWRGEYERVRQRGSDIVAISTDQVFAQRVFKASLGGLPYGLASDWMRTVSEAFGVLNREKGIAARSTFVVDRDGRLVFQNLRFEAGNAQHYAEVIDALPA